MPPGRHLFLLGLALIVGLFPHVAEGSIAGVWDSDFGPVTIQHGSTEGYNVVPFSGFWWQGKGKKGSIGNGRYNVFTGQITLEYYMPWNNTSGTAVWQLSSNGRSMTGSYRQPSGEGAWNLVRTNKRVQAPTSSGGYQNPPISFINVNGNWNSEFGPVTISHGTSTAVDGMVGVKGSWIQDGKVGTIIGGEYYVTQRKIHAAYFMPWNKLTGDVWWVVAANGRSMTGTYTQQGKKGSWKLWR